eukprot:6618325-Prymnesium_polylepis.1
MGTCLRTNNQSRHNSGRGGGDRNLVVTFIRIKSTGTQTHGLPADPTGRRAPRPPRRKNPATHPDHRTPSLLAGMINEFLSEADVWAAHDASLAEPSKPAPAASSSRAFDLDKVVASTKAVNAKPKLVELTTKHRVLPEFEEESCIGLMAPK